MNQQKILQKKILKMLINRKFSKEISIGYKILRNFAKGSKFTTLRGVDIEDEIVYNEYYNNVRKGSEKLSKKSSSIKLFSGNQFSNGKYGSQTKFKPHESAYYSSSDNNKH